MKTEMALPRKAIRAGLILICAGAVVTAAWFILRGTGGGSLPTHYPVPDFSLIEPSGRRVTRADLLGKVWVANFFYTHCPDTCPLQTAEMVRLQVDFPSEEDLQLVSITIDPDRDTPEALAAYAKKFGAKPGRWLFLTGKRKEIYDLVQKGFRLSVALSQDAQGARAPLGALLRLIGPAPAWAHHPTDVNTRYTHSSRFVLVDRKADIRGYYHSDDAEALRRLRRDVRKLLAQD